VFSREQRIWICTRHDAESIEFAEYSWHAQQAPEHVARHHGSRKYYTLHGGRWHRSKPGRRVDGNTGIDRKHYESWNGDTKRWDRHPSARNCNPQSRDSNSESQHGNAEQHA
jgi:hypothetical protein